MGLTIMWLALMVVCLIVEATTLGLVSIWFAGGAFLALIISLLGGPMWLQVTTFLLTSIVLLILTRPMAAKFFNKDRLKTNADSITGKQAIVTGTIDNLKGEGQIVTDGMEWTARSVDNTVIEEGAIVTIERIEGVKAIVKIKEKGEE